VNRQSFNRQWRFTVFSQLVLIAVSLALGIMFERVFPLLTLTLLALLGWHLGMLWRLGHWQPIKKYEDSGGIAGAWQALFDDTRRRSSESKHRKRRLNRILSEFRDATNALPDAMVVLDRGGKIRWFNPAAETLLGLRTERDTGRPLSSVVSHNDVRTMLEEFSGETSNLLINAPADHARRLRLRLFDYGDQRLLLIARDVTEIERVDTIRRDFIANISHELRSPLTVFQGYLETMADTCDVEWQPVIETLTQQSERMTAVVEDLLTLSRLDASEASPEDLPIDMANLIASVESEGIALSGGRHIIKVRVEKGLSVTGCARDLRSALMNLVSNAIRYTPANGQIDISWHKIDGDAMLAVRDNGPGIEANHLPRLAERFYRVSSDRSRASGGTGLGLAIVKNILLLHDARLEIMSTPGQGSDFVCHFPGERLTTPPDHQQENFL
jgi:two-component system phosphate regulon sensor histidine kinase PhoR